MVKTTGQPFRSIGPLAEPAKAHAEIDPPTVAEVERLFAPNIPSVSEAARWIPNDRAIRTETEAALADPSSPFRIFLDKSQSAGVKKALAVYLSETGVPETKRNQALDRLTIAKLQFDERERAPDKLKKRIIVDGVAGAQTAQMYRQDRTLRLQQLSENAEDITSRHQVDLKTNFFRLQTLWPHDALPHPTSPANSCSPSFGPDIRLVDEQLARSPNPALAPGRELVEAALTGTHPLRYTPSQEVIDRHLVARYRYLIDKTRPLDAPKVAEDPNYQPELSQAWGHAPDIVKARTAHYILTSLKQNGNSDSDRAFALALAAFESGLNPIATREAQVFKDNELFNGKVLTDKDREALRFDSKGWSTAQGCWQLLSPTRKEHGKRSGISTPDSLSLDTQLSLYDSHNIDMDHHAVAGAKLKPGTPEYYNAKAIYHFVGRLDPLVCKPATQPPSENELLVGPTQTPPKSNSKAEAKVAVEEQRLISARLSAKNWVLPMMDAILKSGLTNDN